MRYDSVEWLPLVLGLTLLGLVGSVVAWRARGLRSAARGVAWSLLPLAIFLVGALRLVWDVGTSVARFAANLVFSPSVWAGVVLLGVSLVLFVVTGLLRGRTRGRGAIPADRAGKAGGTPPPTRAAGRGPAPRQVERPAPTAGRAGVDDDLDDVEEILRRRGIN